MLTEQSEPWRVRLALLALYACAIGTFVAADNFVTAGLVVMRYADVGVRGALVTGALLSIGALVAVAAWWGLRWVWARLGDDRLGDR